MSGELRTGIGTSTADSITIRGRDLAGDLMGTVTFTEHAFLLAAARLPTPGETKLFDAVLVSLADHGLTPTALAARLTYLGAPESIQGAIAAGLLGGGSVFLGVVEDTARFLHACLEDLGPEPDDDTLRAAADEAVAEAVAAGNRVPGLGHPVHKVEDPRTPRLYAIAAEVGLSGPHLVLLDHVAAAHRKATGTALPVNGAGAAGAALADLGFPPRLVRGFAILARAAGLVGHLAEEMADPMAMTLYRDVEERAVYVAGEL
ncbi:MAG TPA: citryl-CoA lyase [Actinomycetes bacterium]|jgi:citrate synthase|nr:citryl-CoA lyase [Actinomycetes bacterium]